MIDVVTSKYHRDFINQLLIYNEHALQYFSARFSEITANFPKPLNLKLMKFCVLQVCQAL